MEITTRTTSTTRLVLAALAMASVLSAAPAQAIFGESPTDEPNAPAPRTVAGLIAGVELPPLEIRFGDAAHCTGQPGIYRHRADRPVLSVCMDRAVAVFGATAAQEALVQRMVARFPEAGLDLPPLDFRFSDDPADCLGRKGIHRFEGDRSSITICIPETGFTTELLFLHEMAHAWDRHSLGSGNMTAFMDLRDIEVWRTDDPAVQWHEKGAEQAAEIITWALSDRPIKLIRIYQNSCEEIHEGYVTLTGSEPLFGLTDHC